MNLNKCLLLIFVLITISLSIPNNENVKMEARIYFKDITELYNKLGEFFSELDIATRDETEKGEPYLVIISNQEQLELIKEKGLKVEITYPDIKEKFRLMTGVDPNNLDMLRDFGYFFTYWEMIDTLNDLNTNFPTITRVFNPGNSHQGRPLLTLKISDNPLIDEPEPAVYINGATHAREPGGTHCCIDFATYLLVNYGHDSLITWLVNNREIYITPVMNPDGYVYNSDSGGASSNWRKNRRIVQSPYVGVDLNRNYGYRWGVDNSGSSPTPSSETYRGPSPFSEIETQVARDMMINQKIRTQLDYHTYGQYNMYPWGYGTSAPPDSLTLKEMVDTFRLYNQYLANRTGQISRVMYLANGNSVDWEYADTLYQGNQKFITYATTIEWGRTDFWYGWNLPAYVDSECLKNRPNSLYLTRIAGVFFEPKRALINDSLLGNMTNQLDPGETAYAWFELRNRAVHPLDSAYQLIGKLKSLDTMVIILDSIKSFPTCRRKDSTDNRLQQFKFYCRYGTNSGRVVNLRLEMNYKDDTLTMMQPLNFALTIGSNPILTYDVSCTKIEAPFSSLDSGTVIIPACSVYNFGSSAVNYPVRMKIGNSYNRTTSVTTHLPNTLRYVTFPACTLYQRGSNAVTCSTELVNDMQNANDKQTGLVSVRVSDVGVVSITLPDTISYGMSVTPICSLYNYGTATETYQVLLKVNGVFTETLPVSAHLPSTYTNVIFTPLTPQPGTNTFSCSLAINDMNQTNDTMTKIVFVQSLDVGATKIVAPTGTIILGTVIIPACSVYNYGNTAVSYSVRFKIGDFYDENTLVLNHLPGVYELVTFPSLTANQIGTYVVSCSTELVGDINTTNDERTDSVIIIPVNQTGWIRMANIPQGSSGKNPKSGSCLVGLNDKIYFLKASNTSDFHIYTPDVGIGFWTTESIPLGVKPTNGKKPKKGASIAAHDNYVYVLRGNNTQGFWKYIPTTSAWETLPPIPTGASGKKCKDGSGMVSVTISYAPNPDTDYLFVMKGSKTTEFFLYNLQTNTWSVPLPAPSTGSSGKIGYGKGSCLCYDGDSLVYVLKGNYGDFFKYNLYTGNWTELRRYDAKFFLNRDGKKKRPKDGAGLGYYDNAIYMLKGGNTNEFWKYEIALDTWIQLGPAEVWDIPNGNGKKVKGGGCLAILGDKFYAVKGANTSEFYAHTIPTKAVVKALTASDGVMSRGLSDKSYELNITPNPAGNLIAVSYSLPAKEKVNFKLYNISGALIKTYINEIPSQDGRLLIDTKLLSSGVYILRFNSTKFSVSRKLVIEK